MSATETIVDAAYQVAVDAALQAGDVMLPFWPNINNARFDDQRTLDMIGKEGLGNYATVADIESERHIISLIQGHRLLAGHSIVAEESDPVDGDSDWWWSIDPIDGTINFRTGNLDFGVCIALFNGNEPVVGVIAMPALGQYAAVKVGEPAVLFANDGRKIADLTSLAARHVDPLDNSLVGYCIGYTERQTQLNEIADKVVGNVGFASSLGAYSTTNFRMLQGMMGGCIGRSPTIMDIAPAAALVPAVGGVVTDMEGKPIDWRAPDRTYLAAVNPEIHAGLLRLLNQ